MIKMLELNKVYNMDFLLNKLPDECIDLVVTDPPYKLTSGGCKNTKIGGICGNNKNKFISNGKVFKYNNIKSIDWFNELYRVLKNGSHCYIMCNDKHMQEYLNNAEKVGFKEVNILIWNKGMHTPTQYYMKCCEFILMFRKGKSKYINNMGSKTLINIKGLKGNKKHPSEKPIDLMEFLILNSSNENDIVLDPFMGVGSTILASIKNNRKYIGYEIDKKYYDIVENILNK